MPPGDVSPDDVEHVRRMRLRREKQNLGEVIVLFSSIEVRDRVSSYARNLSAFIDAAGRPTAGIRIDVPDHLLGVHRTLIQYGHAMWIKHKKDPEMKRNIRFDDVELSFCIDFRFPAHKDWISVSFQRALRDRRSSVSSGMLANDDLLSTAACTEEKELSLEHLSLIHI